MLLHTPMIYPVFFRHSRIGRAVDPRLRKRFFTPQLRYPSGRYRVPVSSRSTEKHPKKSIRKASRK